jgi:hypothetical protein
MKIWIWDHIVCRTVGCTSWLANWFEWPYKLCHWWVWKAFDY